jgi:pyruvate-ferredoxin/flavodoxin oxidoreductase
MWLSYHLFEYVGHAKATDLVVIMGSGCAAAASAVERCVDDLGARVGVVKVRLFRPWSAKHFLAAVPKSVRRVAVLDRCAEPGALADPLFLDVTASFHAGGWLAGTPPSVIGGRYGLRRYMPAPARPPDRMHARTHACTHAIHPASHPHSQPAIQPACPPARQT